MRRASTAKQATFVKRSACWLKVFLVAVLFCHFPTHCLVASNAIELIDYGREAAGVDYAQKIQAFHRFLVDHLSSEGNAFPHNPSLLPRGFHSQSPSSTPISQLIGIDGKNIRTCSHCKDIREKDNLIHVVDLVYSRKVSKGIILLNAHLLWVCQQPISEQQPTDFASILQDSLFRTIAHKATCQNCKQYSTFTICRSLSSRSLPPFLAVNASVYDEDNLSLWRDSRNQRFFQPQVHLHGQVRGINDSEKVSYIVRVCHSFLLSLVLHDRLYNNILGYGSANYDETGRIAFGSNNKRWALPTVLS